MNLRSILTKYNLISNRITDSMYSGTFTVGNLNDYINIINKYNINGNCNLSLEDFSSLETKFNGEVLSYKVLNEEDFSSLLSKSINGELFLNIYKF